MENNYTLYYPTIEFDNPQWLWSASLIWDRIYRIVPDNYTPQDSRNIKELICESDIISNINPKSYSLKACDEFIHGCKKETWWAAALDSSNYTKKDYIQMHKDKADVKLREMILAKDIFNNDWLQVPQDMASIYMLFLANYIAKQNDLTLSTCRPEAWCGSNFFQHDGNISDYEEQSQTQLACITISEIIPYNILDIEPKQFLKMRENRTKERQRFFNSIKNLSETLSTCNDPNIVQDIILDYFKEIKEAEYDYKKSMKDIKIRGWMGIKSLMIPVALPVMGAFFDIPIDLLNKLGALGIGIGIVGAFWETRNNISKNKNNSDFDYLFELAEHGSRLYSKDFKNNIHTNYQLYLMDNLNHFLRD